MLDTNSPYLKIGDCIMLYAEPCLGFMAATGFNMTDVFIQKCLPNQVKLMPNMRNMVFKVMPKLVYDATREYVKEKKSFDKMMVDAQNELNNIIVEGDAKNDDEENQERDAASRNLAILKTRMDQEQDYNQRINKSRQGEVVNYGSSLQLQHLDSSSYLQISKQQASQWKDCFGFELSMNPTPTRVIFDILPRYKYRTEGDKVVFGDHILFLNTNKGGYIHYSNDRPITVEMNTTLTSTYRPNCNHRRTQIGAIFQKYEVNIGSEAKKWQIFPYRQFIDERFSGRLVFGGNILRFKHAESGGYICIDEDGKTPSGELQGYLRVYIGGQTGEDAEEQVTTNSLFELEFDLDADLGKPTMWDDQKTQEPVHYRLRHLNSGRVLSVKTLIKGAKDIHILTTTQVIGPEHILTDQQLQDADVTRETQQLDEFHKEMAENYLKNSLFILKSSTIDNDNFINGDCVVKIQSVMNNFFLTSVKSKSTEDDEEEEENVGNDTQDSAAEDLELLMQDGGLDNEIVGEGSKIDAKIFTPMNKEEFDFLRQQTLMLRKNHKEEDVFIMKKADPAEISDVLYIHSCVDSLKSFLNYIRKKDNENLTVTYFVQLELLLTDLVFFLTETESKDPYTCEGIPYKKRQKYMRETRVIDLLVDMLYYPFSEKLYNFADLTQRHPITKTCQLVYRLLKHCVKDYNYNKFYVAQYIELYFNQAMTATEQNNFNSESTITELLKNNEVLLDKQITKETIVNFVELCKGQMKNERFLNLLATLCSCNGQAVNSNQDDTCEILLENEENNEALIMKMVKNKQGVYEIVLLERQIDSRTLFIGIANLYEVSLKRDDLRIFNYFKALINLNAEMCLQRNYRGINTLVAVYPLDQVYASTVNENIHFLLRAAFAKFLLHLHIDKDPLEQISVPNFARIWPDIVSGHSKVPQSRIHIGKQLLSLKPFTAQFFKNLGGVQKAYETDFNTYIVELLGLVDAMVRLGFYNHEDDLIQVVDPLISLLDGSLDIIDLDLQKKIDSKNISMLEGGTPADISQQMNTSQVMPSFSINKKDSDELILKTKRYKMNESNLLIMQTKNNIISILQKILDIQNDVRLTQFLTEFYKEDQIEPPTEEEILFVSRVNNTKKLEEMFKKDPEMSELKQTIDQKVVKWMNTAFSDKKLDLERISVADFVCVLLDLILYENAALVNNAFKLLVRFFCQKQAIIDIVSQVQILEKDSEIAILKSVQMQLTEMKREADNAEFWLGQTDRQELMKARNIMERFDMLADLCVQKSESLYDFTDFNRLNKSILKNEIAKLIQRRGGRQSNKFGQENEASVLNDVSEMLADWEDDDMRIASDTEQHDEQNQRLLRNLNAHEIALIIIKQKNLDEAENSGAYLRVLERAYIFLIKFVRNNSENQLILMDKIDEFLEDVDFGVHAFELITEILKNNEKLSSFNLTPIIKKVSQLADDLSIETPKKATLISFLQNFMVCNGVVLKENQSLILNEVSNSNRKNSLHLYTSDSGFESLELYLEEMKRHFSSIAASDTQNSEIFLPNELSYTIQYIKLLAVSGAGRNAMTELKCQSFFSLKDIVENMKQVGFCYPMKEACLIFLLEIYLDTEKTISEDYHPFLWEVIEVIFEDLKKFIEIKIKKISDQGKKRTLTNGSVDANGGIDVTRNFNLRDCFGSQPIIDVLENYIFSQVMQTMNKFFELRLRMNDKQNNLVRNSIRLIAEASKYAGNNNNYIRNINNLYKTFWKIPQLKELTEGLKNQSISLLDEVSNSTDKTQSKVDKSITKASQLNAYMKSANISEDVRNEVELEFQQLIYSIMYIKKKSEIGFNGKNTLDTKEILKSLIKLTDIDSEIEKDLRKTSLKILRKIVEMENKDLNTPSAYWDTDDWDKYKHQILERQDMMVSLGMVKLICRVISNETNIGIKEEAILCAISLLLGGNEKSQKKFCRYIMKDSENVFVQKLKENIIQCYTLIKQTESKRNIMMSKQFSFRNKIDEMIQFMGTSENNEIKKLEQQLYIVEEEMREAEQQHETKDEDVLTPQRALSYLQLIYRFMQLLCENHNLLLQNQLREQINIDGNVSSKTFDFVSQLARMVGEFYKIFNSQSCDLGQQMLDSLIEFIQGPCQGNQIALISAKIIDSSRDFIAGFEKASEYLPLGFTDSEEDKDNISEFKSKIVTLLLSLLEGDVDTQKINDMADSLDFTVVKDRMLVVFTQFAEMTLEQSNLNMSTLTLSQVNNKLTRESFEESINEAFELYILMQTLASKSNNAKQQLQRKRFNQEQWKAYDFIRTHTGRIEISVDGNLQSVYFPIRPVCHYQSEQIKRELMTSVNRDSQSNKVDGLMAAAPDLIDEMIHNEKLGHSSFPITPERLTALKDFSTFLSVFINVVMLLFLERVNHYKDVYIPDFAQSMITYGGIIQGISSAVLIIFYASARGGLITKAKWRDFVHANLKTMKTFENEDRLELNEMSIEMTHNILMTEGPEAQDFNVDGKLNFGNAYTALEYKFFSILFFIQDGVFIYYVLYFIISLLGFFYLDIFYSFHLLDFVSRSPVLLNVIKAMTQNGKMVMMTALLLLTVVYIYTIIGFFYLQDTMTDQNVNKFETLPSESLCSNMIQCFVKVLDAGLRNGGGIGDATLPVLYGSIEKYYVVFAYNCSFQILVIITLLSILLGIVIDTFAQLRDQKHVMDLDMHNICFICSIDRQTFDKYSEGFERHIERDHNLWQYVYYIVHLQCKDSTDYTGIESYVCEKYDAGDNSWIPLMKAICLQGTKYETSGGGPEGE